MSRHRIAVLIGDQAFNAASIVPWDGQVIVPAARSGQPASLLDADRTCSRSRRSSTAANARRQQAAAEWFPRLFLGALFGSAERRDERFRPGRRALHNVRSLLTMPIFNAGRTRPINEIAESEQSEALLRYEDGIVRALEDVENSLVALADERRRAEALQRAAASADSALGRAQSLYDRGQIDLLPLLDAQRTRLTVRLSANDSHTELLLDSVRLYKALGGGWQVFEPQQPSATAAAAMIKPAIDRLEELP